MEAMSLHPSYISPKLDFSEPPPPPKPGKGYGIVSIVFGVVAIFTIAFILLLDILIAPEMMSGPGIIIDTFFTLFLCSPLFVIAGIIFGFLGLGTEGRRYATIGLVLNALPILGVIALPVLAFAIILRDVFTLFSLFGF